MANKKVKIKEGNETEEIDVTDETYCLIRTLQDLTNELRRLVVRIK